MGLECVGEVCAEPTPSVTTGATTGADTSGGAPTTDAGSDTSPAAPVYLYATVAEFRPGLDPLTGVDVRATVDAACANEMDRVAACTASVAVFSVDTGDTVADLGSYGLPMDNPLVGPGGEPIADSLQVALDTESVLLPLEQADVLPGEGISSSWWTGASPSGGLDGEDCTGWSTDMTGTLGAAGVAEVSGSGWLSQDRNCDNDRRLLCACW